MSLASHVRDAISVPVVRGGTAISREVTQRIMRAVDRALAIDAAAASGMICETLYHEEQRLADGAAGPNNAQDRAFVRALRHDFARCRPHDRRALIERSVGHYAREITGRFDRRVYAFTTSVVPSALGALLHGGRPSGHLFDVDERILLEGDVAGLKRAARSGTVVLVPTHVSNLDSLVLGYAIYRLGLPPFAYGAGLNLFGHALMGYFMRHLGAFTVDRNKRDPLYLAVVKEYATVLLEHGQHMLFFPGGTRSRSGTIEEHIKLGFLSRVVTAFVQRRMVDPHSAPLYVVPCTLTYPLVLEAGSLIEEFLTKQGGPQFVDVRDELAQPARWLGFLAGLAELDVEIHVRFGSPLDPFGNAVNEHGASLDASGRILDPMRYVQVDGVVTRDAARDAEYTRSSAARIVGSFKREAVALPSSVLAFALFSCLCRRYPMLDLFRLLRVLGPHQSVPLAELEPEIDRLLGSLQLLAASGRIQLAPALTTRGKAAVLDDGLTTLGAYHRPAIVRCRAGALEVADPTLLLYYRNRLDGYGLPGCTPSAHLAPGRSYL
jgi:glycerol-3-phosphate O-acyltransferase